VHNSHLVICEIICKKEIVVIQKQIEKFIASIDPGHTSLYSNISHAILYFFTTLCYIINSKPFE